MRNKGFTLVELLAVIVILAIILAIAIPSITNVINNSTKNSFSTDAKMVIKTIQYKMMEDNTLNPNTLTVSNLTTLNISNDNYENIYAGTVKNEPYLFIIGKNKWAGLYACGGLKTMTVYDNPNDVNCKFDYDYTGNYQTFVAPVAGTYKLQVWGAQGGTGGDGVYPNTGWNPGEGGYSEGNITLTAGQSLYIYIGGRGHGIPGQQYRAGLIPGGWNGGGNAYHDGSGDGGEFGGGGGGATDVRTTSGVWNNATSLASRIIVAGGGGGTGEDAEFGGNGGGTTSAGDFNASFTATQTAAGLFGGLGYGASYRNAGESNGAGGGGYYGGGGGIGSTTDHACYGACGSGGGSGYIGGVTGGTTIAGNASMPSPSGATQTGQTGNGYAIITLINI